MDSHKLFRLDGRSAFVSAARGHLGRAMTRALAQAGAHVIVNGRDDAALAMFTNRNFAAEGLSVGRAAFDAADPAALGDYFAGLSRLDILVNNAVSMTVKPFAALTPRISPSTYASSVTAAFVSGARRPAGPETEAPPRRAKPASST